MAAIGAAANCDDKRGYEMSTKSIPVSTAACCGPNCCGGETATAIDAGVKDVVREKYGQTAKSGLSSDNTGVRAVAEAFGYSADELTSIPAEVLKMQVQIGTLQPGAWDDAVVFDLQNGEFPLVDSHGETRIGRAPSQRRALGAGSVATLRV